MKAQKIIGHEFLKVTVKIIELWFIWSYIIGKISNEIVQQHFIVNF